MGTDVQVTAFQNALELTLCSPLKVHSSEVNVLAFPVCHSGKLISQSLRILILRRVIDVFQRWLQKLFNVDT